MFSLFDNGEEQDEIQELRDMEQANQVECTGFQSHRHHLGINDRSFKPTLLSDQEAKMTDLQQTLRDPAMMTKSEKKLLELRHQLLNSQLSATGNTKNAPPQLCSQGTNLTEELLKNYDNRLVSLAT